MDFTQPDDGIHMLSWDNSDPKPIVVDESYEVDGVILKPQASAPFTLVLDTPLVQQTTIGTLICPCYSVQSPFILSRDLDERVTQDVQYVIHGSKIVQKQLPIVARPLESDATQEKIE